MKVFDADDYGTEIQAFWIDDDMVEQIANKHIKFKIKQQNKRALDAATSKTLDDNKNFDE